MPRYDDNYLNHVSLSQLFPQIAPVMINPLREAYDHYERLRLKDEKLLPEVDSTNTTNEPQKCSNERKWVSRDTSVTLKENNCSNNQQTDEKQVIF